MRAKWLWAAGVTGLAGLAVGCGGGHAIFNVDAYSFLKGTGKDIVPYAVPPGVTIDTSTPPQLIRLVGAASSVVDSVVISGTADLQNQSGTGTLAFKLYLAADSAGTLLPGALALSVPAKAVSGLATVRDTISCPPRPSSCLLFSSANSLFTRDSLWVRVAVTASNPSLTPPPLVGRMVLTSLLLSVVLNAKLF